MIRIKQVSHKEANNRHYQRNKTAIQEKRRIRYQIEKEKKEQEREREEREELAKYLQAGSVKVLLSFKEYTELNPAKKKLWMDFSATLSMIKEGVGDIVEIQMLEQITSNLVRDYYATAKEKIRSKGSWNSLSSEEQEKFIRFWAREKVRRDDYFSQELGYLELLGKEYEQEVELAKFHEERGKKGCACWDCAEKKKVRGEIRDEWAEREEEKENCPECGKLRVLDEESGVCKECVEKFGE